MKFLPTVFGVLIAAMFLVSCGDDGVESLPGEANEHSSEDASQETEDGLDGLELNNGQKWQMDEHTRSVFAKMATSFLGSDISSLEGEGLKNAGAGLQGDINELIRGCTMTGDAHDQLHVYLTGYMPAVASLSHSGQMEDAKKVRHYLENYDTYFE